MTHTADAVVIGTGVIGAAVAYELAQTGLSVLAQTVCAALRRRLPGYHAATRHPPEAVPQHRRHHRTPSWPDHHPPGRRTYSPVLRQADLPETITVPWWGGQTLRYQYD